MQQLNEKNDQTEDMTLDDIGKTPIKVYISSFIISTFFVYIYSYFF